MQAPSTAGLGSTVPSATGWRVLIWAGTAGAVAAEFAVNKAPSPVSSLRIYRACRSPLCGAICTGCCAWRWLALDAAGLAFRPACAGNAALAWDSWSLGFAALAAGFRVCRWKWAARGVKDLPASKDRVVTSGPFLAVDPGAVPSVRDSLPAPRGLARSSCLPKLALAPGGCSAGAAAPMLHGFLCYALYQYPA